MVHPGAVVFGVVAFAVAGVVVYELVKDEINDFLDSFEKPHTVGGDRRGYQRQQERRGSSSSSGSAGGGDDYFFDAHSSSAAFQGTDYELRQRRPVRSEMSEHEKEEEPDHAILMERLRKINATEAALAADEARLAEMERSMREREETLQRSILEQEQRHERQRQQAMALAASMTSSTSSFPQDEPLIRNFNDSLDDHPKDLSVTTTATSTTLPEVDPRTADAILRHNLSSNHSERVNPFEDPASLLVSSSTGSSVRGDDEDEEQEDRRSITIGGAEDEISDIDWTEAEIESIGSHESFDSWGSP